MVIPRGKEMPHLDRVGHSAREARMQLTASSSFRVRRRRHPDYGKIRHSTWEEGMLTYEREGLMPASRATDSLGLVVTADCNLRCAYCYQDRKQPRQMSWPTMSRALDLLTSSSRRRADVTFLGGEPLLGYPLIVRAVRRLGRRFPAKRRPDYVIATNGLLLTPRRLAFLERHRFDIQLSFDGVAPSQDLRSPGSFAILDRLLDRLSLRHRAYFRRRVMAAVTVTAPAIPHLADSFDYLLGKGVEDIAIGPAMGHPRLSKSQGSRARPPVRPHLQAVVAPLPRNRRGTAAALPEAGDPHRGSRQGAPWRALRRPGGTSRSTWTARCIPARCSFVRARPWHGLRSRAAGGHEPRARDRCAGSPPAAGATARRSQGREDLRSPIPEAVGPRSLRGVPLRGRVLRLPDRVRQEP